MTKDQKWYSITITDLNNLRSETLNITGPLTKILINLPRGSRFKVFDYQSKKNGNKIFLIPAEAFQIYPTLFEKYKKVEVKETFDVLTLESMDGIHQSIILED